MAQIEVISEHQTPTGLTFTIQVLDDQGAIHKTEMTLSWADYNLWSPDGAARPADIAEAVIAFMLSRGQASDLRQHFDASLARRLHADADERIPGVV